MASIRKALSLSFASKYSSLAIHTVAVMVLARLLTPAEIGVYSVGAAMVALAHVLREFGVGNYLVQEKELTEDRIRTAFGVAIVIAWAMAAVLFALSGPAADFYDEAGLGQVLQVLSLTFLVIPFGSPILALLHRELAFGRLYVVEVASALAHVTTGIALAALGYGFMSLAWASFAGAIATATVAALFRPSIARTRPSLKDWQRVMSFGGKMTLITVVSQIGVKAPDLIVGHLLGFKPVGLYSRAAGLISTFNQGFIAAILPVQLSYFANENRKGKNLKTSYLNAVAHVTVIAWPFFALLTLLAFPAMRVLFGNQWDDAVPIAQLLCVAAIINAGASLAGNLFVALGTINELLKIVVAVQSVRIISIFIVYPFGIEAIAASQIVVYVAQFAGFHYYMRTMIQVSLFDFFRANYKSAIVCVVTILPVLGTWEITSIENHTHSAQLLVGITEAAIGWYIAVLLVGHPIKSEIGRITRAMNDCAKGFLFRRYQAK